MYLQESDRNAWGLFSSQVGGQFVERSEKVQTRFRNWIITLDTYTADQRGYALPIPYTRMRAPYLEVIVQGVDDFWFKVRPRSSKGVLGGIIRLLLGAPDIEVGQDEIDEYFSVEANDESRVRSLFENPKFRQLIRSQPTIDLRIRYDAGFFELYFLERGIITDVGRLTSLVELFKETLNQLSVIGAASEEDPKISL